MSLPASGAVPTPQTEPGDAGTLPPKAETIRSVTSAARLVSFALVCALLYWGKVVAVPLALSILFSFVLNPLVKRFQAGGMTRGVAVTVTMVLSTGMLAAITTVIGSQLISLSHDLPKHRESIITKIQEMRGMMKGGAMEKLEETVETMATELEKPAGGKGEGTGPPVPREEKAIPVYITTPRKLLEFEGLAALQPVLDMLTTAGLVFLLVVMLLLRWDDMRSRLISFSGHKNISVATRALDDAGHRITRYLLMQLIVNGSYGITIGIALYFVGVPYAALWGLCAALFRYVPYVGPLVGALLPLAFSFVTSPGWQQPLWVGGIIICLELVSNNVIEPWLYGSNLGLSAMGIIVSAVAWTFLWGPVGLMIATPLTVVLVVMGEYVPAFSIFSRLLGDKPVMEPHFQFYQRLLAGDRVEATDMVRQFLKENEFRDFVDRIFVPALALAKRDDTAGMLTKEDTDYIRKSTEDIFEMFREAAEEDEKKGAEQEEAVAPAEPPLLQPAPVVIWPVNELAAIAARLSSWMLRNSAAEVIIVPPQALLGEVMQEIRERQPAVVCVMNLAGSDVARSRQFVRRLKSDHTQLPVVVARLGTLGTLAHEVRDVFRDAGASAVTRTLQETNAAVLPFAIAAARPASA